MPLPETPLAAALEAAEWEDEGGALAAAERVRIPPEIEAVTVTRYRVGPYTYSTLADAMAQYRRVLSADGGSRTLASFDTAPSPGWKSSADDGGRGRD